MFMRRELMFNALEYMFNVRELVFNARKHNFSRHKDTSFCLFHKKKSAAFINVAANDIHYK